MDARIEKFCFTLLRFFHLGIKSITYLESQVVFRSILVPALRCLSLPAHVSDRLESSIPFSGLFSLSSDESLFSPLTNAFLETRKPWLVGLKRFSVAYYKTIHTICAAG
jgi:hypothetical protein